MSSSYEGDDFNHGVYERGALSIFNPISAMLPTFSELHNLRTLPNTYKTVFLFV